MQVHHKGAYKSSLDPMELHHKEGDRSSLETLSFGTTSGTPIYQSTLDAMQVHHKGAYKSSLGPMELHDKEGDRSSLWRYFWYSKLPIQSGSKSSLGTMPMHHKGDGKSSLDLMELHHEELDRPSLEPLSFGFTYDTPSCQSSLDLNPVWIQCKCIIKEPIIWLCFWHSKLPVHPGTKFSLDHPMHHKGVYKSSLDPLELHHKELDRSSLESLSFGFASGTPSHQSSLDLNPVWIKCKSIIKEPTNPVWIQWNCNPIELDRSSLEPLPFGFSYHDTRSYQSSLDPNPVWIQRKCVIKEPTNPVWIQCQCTIKEMANPVWI